MRLTSWVAAHAGVVALFALARMATEPYDDAHFFKRVALNALATGTPAWNVDEGAVYGSTSQLFQWLAIPVTALAGDYYMSVNRLLAAASLVGAFALLLQLTKSLDKGLATTLTFTSPAMLYPVLSGMETTLVFLLMALAMVAIYAEGAERRHWAMAPALVMLVYLVRPDAALLIMPPLLSERLWRTRRLPVREAALIALALALLLAAFRLYYGTALPLPFYAKHPAWSPYDAHFLAVSRGARSLRFGGFVAFAGPALMLALQKRDRTNLVLLGSIIAFCAYHFFFTIDVMGMHGRFYAPALPPLAFAAARGASELAQRAAHKTALTIAAAFVALFVLLWAGGFLPKNSGFRLERIDPVTYVLLVPGLAVACACAATPGRQQAICGLIFGLAACSAVARVRGDSFQVYSDDEFLALQTSRYTVYRGLDTLRSCFGERIHVYHSEVGLPGLRFQRGKVSDLAGLLSPRWLFRARESFDALCAQERPEAIFLPHKNYRELNREIASGQCIAGYMRVVESSSSPLYVRSDLYPRYRDCARARGDPYAAR